MFDIIGKRKWFYLLSLAVTIPGLIFIALTVLPNSNLGLQFSIDYTGGTLWEIHFANGTPSSSDVQRVLAAQGLSDSSVTISTNPADGKQYVLIRTEPIGLQPVATPTPEPTGGPSVSPGASGSPAASVTAGPGSSPGTQAATPQPATPSAAVTPVPTASPTVAPTAATSASPAAAGAGAFAAAEAAAASGSPVASVVPTSTPVPTASPAATPSPAATATPAASASVAASASPAPSATPSPSTSPAPSGSAAASVGPSPSGGGPQIPATGKLAELATALEAEFGPIDAVLQETSVGPVVSQELIQQAFMLILFGAVGIMLWITFRFNDFRMGVTAIVALIHDVIVVVGVFAILGTFFHLQLDALFVTAMLTVIGFQRP